MPMTASSDFIAETRKWQNSHPAFRVQIDHGGTTYEETQRVLESSSIDRILEKWDSFGLALAGQVSLTLANHDQRYSPAKDTSPFFPDTVIGDTVRIYLKFYKHFAGTYASPNIYASPSLYLSSPQTEEILQFTGIVKSVRQNSSATATLIIRDAIQDLLDGRYTEAASYSGDPATVIKEIAEASGATVNPDEYALTVAKVAPITCALDTEAGQSYLDAIQKVTVATGLAVYTDELNRIVIYSIYPNFNDFDRFGIDQSGILPYSGDHDDRENFNIANIDGGIEESAVRNKVVLTYLDLTTAAETTVVREDAASIARYGEKALEIQTTLKLNKFSADVWPARLLARYREPRREYRATTSLQQSAINRIGEYIRITDPSMAEAATLFMLRKRGLDIVSNATEIETQDITDLDSVKWAFIGSEIVEADAERISGLIDHLHNKNMESAVNPGVDETPAKWTITAPGAGTFSFLRSDAEARDGTHSANLRILNASGGKASQLIILRQLEALTGTTYTVSFYIKGTIAAGGFNVVVRTLLAVAKATLNVTASYADWTRLTLAVPTNTGDPRPYTISIEPSGGADDVDVYIDQIQIDDGAAAFPFQTNWAIFAFVGHADGEPNPGYDLDGNVNGIINGLDYLQGFEELHKVAS